MAQSGQNKQQATFAGGCFWCMESPFEKLPGVESVISGYTGGTSKSPSYKEVSAGGSGHLEAIQITYDPEKVTFEKLIDTFWRQIDPTDDGGQFVDRGKQYGSAIFYHSDGQKKTAENAKEALGNSGRFDRPIVTPILPATNFYPAEDYHQDYYKTHPLRYKYYRGNSGRDTFLNKHWEKSHKSSSTYQKPSDKVLKEKLTPIQYKVTQKDGTERSFNNTYWDNKSDGIYIDVVSGEPLFSSTHKFESGTGWPSFTQPLEAENVVEKNDFSLFGNRTEVRSAQGDSHLGHVFPDGPHPTGLRYCINSASLEFISKEKLETRGFSQYMELFEKEKH
jgi:peptide methionine sulfoxide reductase msrA/msrB